MSLTTLLWGADIILIISLLIYNGQRIIEGDGPAFPKVPLVGTGLCIVCVFYGLSLIPPDQPDPDLLLTIVPAGATTVGLAILWLVSIHVQREPSPCEDPGLIHEHNGPLDDPQEATREMRVVAEGLSQLLLNINTSAPATIAVTGKWGSGKSSLMRLVQQDITNKADFLVRRDKAPFHSGCESRPATVAPAGSSRSGRWR